MEPGVCGVADCRSHAVVVSETKTVDMLHKNLGSMCLADERSSAPLGLS